jgi:Family of unknown function (DUF5657)
MSIDPTILKEFFKSGTLATVKIALLILILLYAIFTFMLSTKIRSLNRTIFLPAESGEVVIRMFAIIYLLAVLSLFIATLVIV